MSEPTLLEALQAAVDLLRNEAGMLRERAHDAPLPCLGDHHDELRAQSDVRLRLNTGADIHESNADVIDAFITSLSPGPTLMNDRAALERCVAENVALRCLPGAGCDANNNGPHQTIVKRPDGEFCADCGEMTRNGKSKPWMNEGRLERVIARLAPTPSITPESKNDQ